MRPIRRGARRAVDFVGTLIGENPHVRVGAANVISEPRRALALVRRALVNHDPAQAKALLAELDPPTRHGTHRAQFEAHLRNPR